MGHEAGESCGFDHGGSFLKEKTWRRGADGANDVWAKFLKPVMPHLWSRHRSCRLWKRGINSHFWFPGDGEMRQALRCARLCLGETGWDFCGVWIRSFVLPQSFQPAIHLFVLGSASIIRPASSDAVLLPWSPCVTVCATVPSARQKPSRH